MSIKSTSPILTAAEAADFLGLSVESIRKYVQRKRLNPTAVIGTAYVFTQDEIERFKPTMRPAGNPNFQKQRTKKRRK